MHGQSVDYKAPIFFGPRNDTPSRTPWVVWVGGSVADYQPKRGKGVKYLTNHLIPRPANYSSNGDTPARLQHVLR
jgi:hypothetical protein